MCCFSVKRKRILRETVLSGGLVSFLNLLNSFISHTSYVLSAQKNHLSEMVLFSTHNMCCGLVEGKMILLHATLSGGLVDVHPIYIGLV